MIKRERLEKSFLELAQISGLSRKEGKVARFVEGKLRKLGAKVIYDKKLEKLGFETGNLIAYVDGQEGRSCLILNAHLDTVPPVENFGYRKRRGYIESKGSSILGADNRSGVAVILEVIEHLRESGKPHPRIEVVFTVGEEIGLLGAKNLDYSLLSAKRAIVLDAKSPEELIIKAPSAYKVNFYVIGKEAHAGVNPEKGVNAIQVASKGIAKMRLGKIDFETTANIGIINGGTATNIVPGRAEVKGEVRSHNSKKLKRHLAHMREAMRVAVKDAQRSFTGGREKFPRLEEEIIFDYPRMSVKENSELVKLFSNCARELGWAIRLTASNGGSDANIFNANGIESVIFGSGMENVHSCQERLNLDYFYRGALLLAKVLENYKG